MPPTQALRTTLAALSGYLADEGVTTVCFGSVLANDVYQTEDPRIQWDLRMLDRVQDGALPVVFSGTCRAQTDYYEIRATRERAALVRVDPLDPQGPREVKVSVDLDPGPARTRRSSHVLFVFRQDDTGWFVAQIACFGAATLCSALGAIGAASP